MGSLEKSFETLTQWAEKIWQQVEGHLGRADFYAEIGIIAMALILSWLLGRYIINRVPIFRAMPEDGRLLDIRRSVHEANHLVQPVAALILLSFAATISLDVLGHAWFVRAASGIALIFLLYAFADHVIKNKTIILLLKTVGVPIAVLYMLGWLDNVIGHLDAIAIEIGNIKLTLYAVLRTFVFGIVLFWLGRVSNATGQRVIRNQAALEVGTREVVAKLFEIGIFVVIFLLLLNIMGIDLTALAVFGGALGVGLGFGLQQIASNFISGIIILLDRTITIGDYIQLEDGRSGTLRELTMRSATLETYDGKDIMVPNEKFITTAFTNWTHHNTKQRYSLNFSVAYDTNLEHLFEVTREVVASHPKVLSGDGIPIEERPDAEIAEFGDSGIDILVEFWMEGIDDGVNRVGADLLLMIWMKLKEHGIVIPFPQREIKILPESAIDVSGAPARPDDRP